MPFLLIRTNQDIDDAEPLMAEASNRVSKALGKPERYVMVAVETGLAMRFSADNGPCAFMELKSIGLPPDRTGDLSEMLCGLVQEFLDVPPDRVFIEFADAPRHMWGWNGGTF